MKIALIPPVSQLSRLEGRKYQMMIPSFARSIVYRNYYKMLGEKPQYHLMLDCGAFEGAPLSQHDLLEMAIEYKADEVVPPDILGDGAESFHMLNEFMSKTRHPAFASRLRAKVMAAVQGQTLGQCYAYIDRIYNSGLYMDIPTLGIPKHLTETTGHYDARTQIARYIDKKHPGVFTIHFLGFVGPGDAIEGARLDVRSLDTSAPFICAAENMLLSGSSALAEPSTVPKRQINYTALGKEYFHPKVINANIDILDMWAQGEKVHGNH